MFPQYLYILFILLIPSPNLPWVLHSRQYKTIVYVSLSTYVIYHRLDLILISKIQASPYYFVSLFSYSICILLLNISIVLILLIQASFASSLVRIVVSSHSHVLTKVKLITLPSFLRSEKDHIQHIDHRSQTLSPFRPKLK